MKSDYRARAIKFLESIYPYIEKYLNDEYGCEQMVNKFNYDKHRQVKIANGMVRVALINSDYVVKFDYDKKDARKYGGCEIEARFYQYAKEAGYAYLLAEITPFEYCGHMFYIMPRVRWIGRRGDNAEYFMNRDDRAWIRKNVYDTHYHNYGWVNNYPVIIDYAWNKLFEEERNKRSE